MDPNTLYLFDKEYNDYKTFRTFFEYQTGFVTQLKDNAVCKTIEKQSIGEHTFGCLRR